MTFLDSAPRVEHPASLALTDLFDPVVATIEDGVPTLALFVGGEWRPAAGGELREITSPVDGSTLARVQQAHHDDVEAAVAAARAAQDEFAGMPAAERLDICERAATVMSEHFDTFVDTIVVDLGKIPGQAKSEANATRERLKLVREEVRKISGEYLPGDWIADTEGKNAVVLREPLGTVAAIGPFNYPLFLSASKIIPALAAGNTVVAKAPSDDPIALLLFARVLEEAGLPAGALNVITGPGSEIGDLLAGHEHVNMISMTGSSAIGRHIAELAGVKPLHLELGGNAAAIICADADLDRAVSKSVSGAFKSSGQRCDAISRVLVAEDAYDAYVDRAVAEAKNWPVGDPRAEGVQVGPLVNTTQVQEVARLVADAQDKGARLLLGGENAEAYHQPTVLVDVPTEAEIFWEETFGPVLSVTRVRDLDHALELANASRYGLDSAVFTDNLDEAWRAARALQCGQVTVNDAPQHGVGHFPFGGHKPDSGVGREGLGYSITECTQLKTIVLRD